MVKYDYQFFFAILFFIIIFVIISAVAVTGIAHPLLRSRFGISIYINLTTMVICINVTVSCNADDFVKVK